MTKRIFPLLAAALVSVGVAAQHGPTASQSGLPARETDVEDRRRSPSCP